MPQRAQRYIDVVKQFADAQLVRQASDLASNTRKQPSSDDSDAVIKNQRAALQFALSRVADPLSVRLLCDIHARMCGTHVKDAV